MRQIKITQTVTNRSEILDMYMRDVQNFQLITVEEEADLATKIQNGDKDALNKLVEANLRFVISVAKQYQNLGLTLPDLINEGNIGLVKAAQLYDPTRGMKFITYAVWWIRQQMSQAISQSGRTIRVPVNKIGIATKISKTKDELAQELQRDPTENEIAERMNISVDLVTSLMQSVAKLPSIDMPTGEDEDGCMKDFLPDMSIESTDAQSDTDSLKHDLNKALSILSEREKRVLVLFYGIGRTETGTEEIAADLGISAERVRQLKDNAIRKLRRSSAINILKQYL